MNKKDKIELTAVFDPKSGKYEIKHRMMYSKQELMTTAFAIEGAINDNKSDRIKIAEAKIAKEETVRFPRSGFWKNLFSGTEEN